MVSWGDRREGYLLAGRLLVAARLLGFGLLLPVMRVEHFLVFSEETSLIALTFGLLRQGDGLLASVIGLFSILFPAGKLALLGLRPPRPEAARRFLGGLEALARWSLLDVFVVALVVFSVRASGWAGAMTRPGLYCFAGAVIATMLAAAVMRRRLAKTRDSAAEGTPPDFR